MTRLESKLQAEEEKIVLEDTVLSALRSRMAELIKPRLSWWRRSITLSPVDNVHSQLIIKSNGRLFTKISGMGETSIVGLSPYDEIKILKYYLEDIQIVPVQYTVVEEDYATT